MKINIYIKFVLLLLLIISCDTEQDIENDEIENLISQKSYEDPILGRKLENPYSVTNMRIAFENLKSNQLASGKTSDIKATHLYVKFKPTNEDELDLIKRDTLLDLYGHPLDYELNKDFEFYQDPAVPEDQPTYQYCSVKVGYSFPDVDYEILEDLFIPEEIDNTNQGSLVYSIETLVDEALKITNNLEDDVEEKRRSKWRPKGTITLWDDNFGMYKPLQGVKVKARRWFRTARGITNSTGYYSCNKRFRGKARYKIYWKRYHFVIRVGVFHRAKKRGPRKRGRWNWNIKNGRQEYYATIFKASHHYYYKDIKGLRRPPKNSFFNTKLKIRARYTTNGSTQGSHCNACRFLGLFSAINIYNPSRDSRDIYGTTIHELAHASHWKMARWHYRNGQDHLVESWARGVQWELTRMIYPNYQPNYFGDYSGVVQDMIDNDNSLNDNVTGYTIRQLEDALNDKWRWNDWKTNIKNSYNNGTENNLENLFNYWH